MMQLIRKLCAVSLLCFRSCIPIGFHANGRLIRVVSRRQLLMLYSMAWNWLLSGKLSTVRATMARDVLARDH